MGNLHRLRVLMDWLDDEDLELAGSEDDTCTLLVDEDGDVRGVTRDVGDTIAEGEDLREQFEAVVLLYGQGYEVDYTIGDPAWIPARLALKKGDEVVFEVRGAESWTRGVKSLCAWAYQYRLETGGVLAVEAE